MRYKKIVCLLLAAVLLFSILPAVAATSSDVYFTMVNSNAPDALQESTMPIHRDGMFYVPLSVLLRLGVSSMRPPNEVRLFATGNQRTYIHVDLETGTATTNAGADIAAMPIQRFGTFFFPMGSANGASPLAAFFGISFRLIPSEPVPTVRLYQQIGPLTHNAVRQNGEVLFGFVDRYNAFTGGNAPSAPPNNDSNDILPPQLGGGMTYQTQAPEAEPDASQDPVSLGFVGLREETEELLDALHASQIPAGFFLTAEDVLTHPDLVRRLHGEGHMVGIFLGADAKADYAAASRALFDAARLRTVLVTSEEEESLRVAKDLGLIVHEAPIRRELSPNGATGFAGHLLVHSDSTDGSPLLTLPDLIRSGAYRVVRFVHVIF